MDDPAGGSADVARAYDGSDVMFRVLRAYGWGPLLNLGFFPFRPPLTLLNFVLTPASRSPYFRLPMAQTELVKRSVKLLGIRGDMRVLDVACGRGTASYMIAQVFPEAHLVGVDLLEENVTIARTLHGSGPRLQFVRADAHALPWADASFNRVLCLEAAFHFRDRARFLREAARVLAPAGRMVLVDFVWRDRESRRRVPPELTDIVRRIWRWDDFECMATYRELADASGLTLVRVEDWSAHVTAPLQFALRLLAFLGRFESGRRLVRVQNALMRSLTEADWQAFRVAADAHTAVRSESRYMAIVLEQRASASGDTRGVG
jgi:SAM-dependent methyltransferase